MAWNIAATPQQPLARVSASESWKSRIIEKCLRLRGSLMWRVVSTLAAQLAGIAARSKGGKDGIVASVGGEGSVSYARTEEADHG